MTDYRDWHQATVEDPGSMNPAVYPDPVTRRGIKRRPTEERALAAIATEASRKNITQRELLLRGRLFGQQRKSPNGVCHCAYCRHQRRKAEERDNSNDSVL